MKIIWTNQPLFKKIPLGLVLFIVAVVGFNVYLNLKIKNAKENLNQIESSAVKPSRNTSAEFTKKVSFGEKSCPSIKAGNPRATLKFKIFESETCPYCFAQNKVLDQILPEYGDLFYAEWYQVMDCPKEAEQYKIFGVPTFIFNVQGTEKEPAYGFLDKGQLIDYVCLISGKC